MASVHSAKLSFIVSAVFLGFQLDGVVADAARRWIATPGVDLPSSKTFGFQRCWDRPIVDFVHNKILADNVETERACLLAVSTKELSG